MKLVIQIPCYNEEQTILRVLQSIPKKIKGIDEIKIFLIDDGSVDRTCEIAKNYGIDKIITLKSNKGLSYVFNLGINEAIKEKADILVNLDGDNQYSAGCISKLIEPIIANQADITLGARPINKIREFSFVKKIMQKFGSYVVKKIANLDIKDATTGFRAFNSNAMLKLNVFNSYTYTIESLIQAKVKNLIIKNVDIDVNQQINRKSKLVKNNFDYIIKQGLTLVRFFIIYRPARFFISFAVIFFIFALILGIRFLYYYFVISGQGHIQSLILCSIFFVFSFVMLMLGVVGDLFSINRKILEDIQFQLRQKEYKK